MRKLALTLTILVFLFGVVVGSAVAEDELMVPFGEIKSSCYGEIDMSKAEFPLSEVGEECVTKDWLEEQKDSDRDVNKASPEPAKDIPDEYQLDQQEMPDKNWERKWDQQPKPEYTKERVDNPARYNVQGLRVNADFKVDLQGRRVSWKPNLKEGTYWVPAARAGTPQLTRSELFELKGKPKKAKEEITVLYEALAFMNLAFDNFSSGNVKKQGKDGIRWQYPKPAVMAIKEGEANCASSANVINYLLEGDYDDVGFFWMHTSYDIESPGGHVVSYIKDGGKYYGFDASGLIGKRSHYPVEDGDGHYYHGDVSNHIIQSSPKNYAIYWAQRYREDLAFFAMFSSPHNRVFAIGSDGKNVYYPQAFDGANLTIWEAPNDSVEILQANYTPTPLQSYSSYPPYNSYSEVTSKDGQGKPKVGSLPENKEKNTNTESEAVRDYQKEDWPPLEESTGISVTTNKEVVYPDGNDKWMYHLYFESTIESSIDLKKLKIKAYTYDDEYITTRIYGDDFLEPTHDTLEPSRRHGTGFGLLSKSNIHFRDHIFIGTTKSGKEVKGAVRVIFSKEKKGESE